jgi:hypothetical protein
MVSLAGGLSPILSSCSRLGAESSIKAGPGKLGAGGKSSVGEDCSSVPAMSESVLDFL